MEQSPEAPSPTSDRLAATAARGDAPGPDFPGARPAANPQAIAPGSGFRLGASLVAIDAAWTKGERALCTAVILLEILALTLWVALRGLSTGSDGARAGLVFRGLIGAVALGCACHFALRRRAPRFAPAASTAGALAGLLAAKAWANVGVEWSSNLLNWLQQASTLTLFGGLRGVGTRLTLMLALIGGSLATAAGRHITIDLLTRFVSGRRRTLVAVVGWLGAAVICISTAWGFFDHVSIEDFSASADSSASAKAGALGHGLGEAWFVLRKQVALDLKSLPHIVRGEPYADWLTGAEWNAWLESSGSIERYGAEKCAPLRIPDEARRAPMMLVPGEGEPRGLLVRVANLIFPVGLLAIGLRFVLLSLLVLSGRRSVEAEASAELERQGVAGEEAR